jgi:hypothetical protein
MAEYWSPDQKSYVVAGMYNGGFTLRYCEDCGATVLDERAEEKHNQFHNNMDKMVEIMELTIGILEKQAGKELNN